MAIKLLAYAEAGVTTGWERVAREVLTYLHRSGEFDVSVMGVGYAGNPQMRYDYQVYSAGSTREDKIGVKDFNKIVSRRKPDALWLLNDIWNLTSWLTYKPLRVPTVAYFPVDAPNVKWQFLLGAGCVERLATYTQFGAREAAASVRDIVDILAEAGRTQRPESLREERGWYVIQHPLGGKIHGRMDLLDRYQNTSGIAVIPHGLDATTFGVRDKQEARRRFGIAENAFVVLNVNRNQFRKRQDLTIRAFAQFAEVCPQAVLVLHCVDVTLEGWDLEQLARYYGISDRCLVLPDAQQVYTDDELVELYNTADVQINTAGGEGWGLTSIEGAACGVPQLVPDWSATREIWDGYGVLLPVKDYRIEPKHLNTIHACIDAEATAGKLVELWEHPELLHELRQSGFALVKQQWSWSDVGAAFARLIKEAMGLGAPVTRTLDGMLAAREGDVRSELRPSPVAV